MTLKRSLLFLSIVALLSPVAACSHRAVGPAVGSPGVSPPAASKNGATSILFIGNSYTYYHELPQILAELAAGTRVIQTERETAGGQTLQWHYGDGAGKGPVAIARKKWDFVVLQEHSMRPLKEPETFVRYAVLLDQLVDAAGAQTIFYETWARKATPELQPQYDEGYGQVARVTHARLAPVGAAWARVRAERPDIELFDADGSHPTYAGSYLGACVFYGLILGQSPEGTPALKVSADVAAYLQRTAWQTLSAAAVK